MRTIPTMFAAGLAALVVIGMVWPGTSYANQIPVVSTVISPATSLATSVTPVFYGGFGHGGFGLFGRRNYGGWAWPGYYYYGAPAYGYGTCGWNGYYW